MLIRLGRFSLLLSALLVSHCASTPGPKAGTESGFTVTETEDQIFISSSTIEAAIRKRGYVSGVYRQSFLDKKTGFRDAGIRS